MRSRRFFLVLIALIVFAEIAVASGSTANNRSTKRVSPTLNLTVGNLLELTGVASFLGPPFEQAGNTATTVINRAAAAAGIPLRVKSVTADTQADPQAALLAARSEVNKGASCLVGPASTPESLSIANALTIQRRISLWPEASSTAVSTINDHDTVFRTVPDTPKEAIAAANGAAKILGGVKGKTFSIAAFNEPYGTDLAKFFAQVWNVARWKGAGPDLLRPSGD